MTQITETERQTASPMRSVDHLDPKQFIIIKGAKVHNLKGIDVAIPRNKLVVLTGLSGSGKSSLAFDTLFAEGQRMYVESLSSYARQFLGRMEKPEVEYIKGVSPAIAIEQKVSTRNPRSTVGTSTEIYDYLKLLFGRAGVTYSPISGHEVRKDTVTDVVNYMYGYEAGQRVMIMAPLRVREGRTLAYELNILLQKGYTRIVADGNVLQIEDILAFATDGQQPLDTLVEQQLSANDLEILVDRGTVLYDENGQPDEDNQYRFSDSVQTAFSEGEGSCRVDIVGKESRIFSDKFELDGIVFEEPSVNLFTFNNPYGACRRCDGFGKVLGIDPDLVIPDKNLSVFEGAIAPWRSEKMSEEFLRPLLKNGIRFDFPIHRPYKDLTPAEQELLWTGNTYFDGLNAFFDFVESQTFKVQYRVMLSRYRGKTTCPECRGSRLRKDAGYVKVAGKSITDLVLMPITQVTAFFRTLELPQTQQQVANRILIEIRNRLDYMERVGLGYLTLNRLTNTLSGGEYQRIKLATSLGSALVGSMYILDEPSIGLHPRDTKRLVSVLESLRDMGNTVIVVEHEEEVMRAADQLIDIGPDAGSLGGHLVFQGTWDEVDNAKWLMNNEQGASDNRPSDSEHYPLAINHYPFQSHTLDFLTGREIVPVPTFRRKATNFIELKGARENNLKDVDVRFPLNTLTVVTGVSGSGKSTLIRKVLYPALMRQKGDAAEEAGKYDALTGSLDRIAAIEMIDQNPIGKSSRSNPVTYIKAYDYLRQVMADQPVSKSRGYKPSHFSFNVDGGRCEVCQGEGEVKIEMQFMADIYLKCEGCGGKRFKQEVLEVTLHDKNVSDILAMTVDEAIDFFRTFEPKMADKLQPLQDVGLGYIGLGQSANTLSGGEAQRVKLASFLGKGNPNKGGTLFIFDEPTTGLHFHDIRKLLSAINALVDQGDSVIIIEHNMEVIKNADHIIDLGPEGGETGGYVTFTGTPEEMVKLTDGNYTAEYLKGKV
ncbi:ATP-binding cassette domain-containing protein [Spirosoma sp. KCTC 42546]|uniref:excinuclease ABC subunit UvrA n=1 Tax=Spirosoma sp. KCTC 42546 TaxID=2520506 RepID=UPI00115B63FC|nr:ATP-binding cassette domain-containing protein [Spirosoma sp. KCTC 42546]QDK77122.1 ATP-binding cassette domain-containing protein [Spirosoma sp. KCTC 42546]